MRSPPAGKMGEGIKIPHLDRTKMLRSICGVSELDVLSEATWAMENEHGVLDFECEWHPKFRVIEESCKWISEL